MTTPEKQKNQTLAQEEINPLLPDAASLLATLIDLTRSASPTGPEKLYRYTSGTLTAGNTITLTLPKKPQYWVIVVFGNGANTDFTITEEGTPPYYGSAVSNKVRVCIPANSRTVNITKTGNDVNVILAGCTGYDTEQIL